MNATYRMYKPAILVAGLLLFGAAQAQTVPPTPQFDVLGFIQEAALDQSVCPTLPADPRLSGGWMKVNGQKLIVPCNTIIQLPAAAATWADLFDVNASNPIGTYLTTTLQPIPQQAVGQTRLALADSPMPFPSFEVSVHGNVVNGQYIVGLIVPVSQQGLNSGAGIVSAIDYTTGAFRVGGTPGDTNCASSITSASCSGALVQLNDPAGRFGSVHSPDQRFTADTANPTMHHATGYPACIPRQAPPAIDSECPLTNRPLNGSAFGQDAFVAPNAPLKKFTMPPPSYNLSGANTVVPDVTKQAPVMIGDWVTYSGTLVKLDPAGNNAASNSYISAHTVSTNVGIFTTPGFPPAYMTVEDLLIGTNGAAQAGILQEASTRLTVVGFTTDPTRLVDIYAIDVNPCTGAESLRLLATVDPATQPLVGRFVHRVLGGEFMPPTREYMVRSRTQLINPLTGARTDQIVANNLIAGQFRLPNFEYIFPENHTLGDPIVASNFQDLPFLAYGWGPIVGSAPGNPSVVVGQLSPWPGTSPYNPAPTPPFCAAGGGGSSPIVSVRPTLSVDTNAQVVLTGSIAWDLNSTGGSRVAVWTQVPTPGAPTVSVSATTLSGTTASASFVAPSAATALTFRLTATDNFGTASALTNVSVLPNSDIVQIPVGLSTWVIQNGQRGNFGKLNATAVSSNPAAVLTLTELATDGTVIDWGTGVTKASTPGTYVWTELKGAPQPASLTVTSNKGGSATVVCSAPDSKGRVSCP
jgi:hypothetical protein